MSEIITGSKKMPARPGVPTKPNTRDAGAWSAWPSRSAGPRCIWLLMIRASEDQTDLVLVVNWFEELKGVVPK